MTIVIILIVALTIFSMAAAINDDGRLNERANDFKDDEKQNPLINLPPDDYELSN